MIFVHRHLALIIVFTVIVVLITAASAILEAWLDTRKRPREAMFWCHKHGYIRKKHCLELFPGMKMSNGQPFKMCPLCYKSTVYDDLEAKNGLGSH